jgi:hypothetical protein
METELTGDDLRAFAAANGLDIMSHRNPDRWAEHVNNNNGMCPCGKECPCDDCTCKFFTQSSADADDIVKDDNDDEGDYMEISNPEIARAIQTLEDVRQKLIAMPQDTTENASGAIKESEEMVKGDAEKHECGECAKYMEGLARKLRFLKEECETDSMSCVVERDLTIKRIEDMQNTFVAVDRAVSNGEINDNQQDMTQETPKNIDSPLIPSDSEVIIEPFHDCITRTTLEELQDIDHSDRICTASKMCSKKKMSKEDAIAECVK